MESNEKLLNTIICNQRALFNQNRELIYANIFHDTIKGSEWLPSDFSMSPGNAALGYPALYVLYRILNEFHPKSILETGLGQSTKIISLYNRWHEDCHHVVVEHDHSWIDFFMNHFKVPQSTEIVELPITDVMLDFDGNLSNVTVYEGFADRFVEKKFDFMCIDGPFGFRSPCYARVDLFGILPECLAESFVILLDDCNRDGERNTLNLISELLKEKSIPHSKNIYFGEKGTGIIVSDDLAFLCSL